MPLEFHEADISDYDRIQPFFDLYGGNSTQHSFVNLFSLSEKYDPEFCIKDEVLYIHRRGLSSDQIRAYLFPLGADAGREAVEAVLEDAHSYGAKVCFKTITEDKYNFLKENFADVFTFREDRDLAEYIHLTSNLADFPGKKLRNRRAQANKFHDLYGERLTEETLEKKDTDEALAFAEKWYVENKDAHNAQSLETELRAMKKMFAYFDELKLSGIVMRIDGEMQGFSCGAPISPECYDQIIEKGSRDFQYIYSAVCRDSARMCASDYRYINREEAIGSAGLRKAKLEYYPDILLAKYVAEEI
ncbi:MAG: DUF2156 domain-containing protein [Eubacterium sp.]|nr:DUF2156 domain-containing protein [Eubacterium sp.]